MIGWPRILTALTVTTLVAAPVEADQGRTGNLFAAPESRISRTETRTSGPTAGRGLQAGGFVEVTTWHFKSLDLDTSLRTRRIFQPQLVFEETIDQTNSLRTNNRIDADVDAFGAGAFIRAAIGSRFTLEARGAAVFADAAVEYTETTLNTVTKTGGNDWGGSFGTRVEYFPGEDTNVSLYGEWNLVWLDLGAERNLVEVINGATILLDASNLNLRQQSAHAGVSLSFGPDQKFTILTGPGFQTLSVEQHRDLHFLFNAVNQTNEVEYRTELSKSALTFDASVHMVARTFLDFKARGSFGSGVRNVSLRASIFW